MDAGRDAMRPRRGQRPSPRPPWALVLVAAGIAVLVGASLWSALRPREAPAVAPSGVVGTRPGDTAPEFRLVDIEGRVVTRTGLLSGGKPGLLFFTTTWCLPCIEGLRQLQRFQQELGAPEPFRVLIVFVDPREGEADVRRYRDRYGFPRSWFYAPDTDRMVWKYGVRYLDTKFVLDPQAVIRWTDVYPAGYDTWGRALATVGVGR